MQSRQSAWQRCLPSMKQILAVVVATQLVCVVPARANNEGSNDDKTTSPIKHVIIIVGENRTFDHIFATYVPKTGQHIQNLFSKGIIKADGTPGPNFALAHQFSAEDKDKFQESP